MEIRITIESDSNSILEEVQTEFQETFDVVKNFSQVDVAKIQFSKCRVPVESKIKKKDML